MERVEYIESVRETHFASDSVSASREIKAGQLWR